MILQVWLLLGSSHSALARLGQAPAASTPCLLGFAPRALEPRASFGHVTEERRALVLGSSQVGPEVECYTWLGVSEKFYTCEGGDFEEKRLLFRCCITDD